MLVSLETWVEQSHWEAAYVEYVTLLKILFMEISFLKNKVLLFDGCINVYVDKFLLVGCFNIVYIFKKLSLDCPK